MFKHVRWDRVIPILFLALVWVLTFALFWHYSGG